MTVLSLIAWVGFEVYRMLTREPDVGISPDVLSPLDPALDVDTLNKLQERMLLEESEIVIERPTPTPTPIESVPTPTVEPTPTTVQQESTEGETLQ